MRRKCNSFVSLVAVFLFAGVAHAKTTTFKNEKDIVPNLIRESDAISVLNEQSVQKNDQGARRVYSVLLGYASANGIVMNSYDNHVAYNLANTPAFGIQFAYLPILWRGYWGVQGSAQYSYLEKQSSVRTALHWVATDMELVYRHETNEQALLKPYMGVGVGSDILFQRGPDHYNTSEAAGYFLGLVGVAWNMSRTFAIKSPLLWEMNAQYKQIFTSKSADRDLNGHQISLGLSLAL